METQGLGRFSYKSISQIKLQQSETAQMKIEVPLNIT